MATGLQAQWDACYSPTVFTGNETQVRIDAAHFVERISIAVAAVAVTVSQEATSTANHANRVALAKDALVNPNKYAAPYAQAMASQGYDQGSTDAQIMSAVTAGWNFFAGVP